MASDPAPPHYDFGDSANHLVGIHRRPGSDRVPLLGCECGDWGCWPLMHPDRDYSEFGPFRFPEPDFRIAVLDLRARLCRSVIEKVGLPVQRTGRYYLA